MGLTKVERERIQDSQRKIQSVADSLNHIDPKKIRHLDAIEECLEEADRSLDGALKSQD
jgi:hypothetical protein